MRGDNFDWNRKMKIGHENHNSLLMVGIVLISVKNKKTNKSISNQINLKQFLKKTLNFHGLKCLKTWELIKKDAVVSYLWPCPMIIILCLWLSSLESNALKVCFGFRLRTAYRKLIKLIIYLGLASYMISRHDAVSDK